MKSFYIIVAFLSFIANLDAQTFARTQLSTEVNTPWEMLYGPDGYLWLTEAFGTVSRVHPESGVKTIVYTAPDYFDGSPLEQLQLCFMPNIGSGTLGLDLDPNFINEAISYIYFVYSYNSGTDSLPATKFKLARLTWDSSSETVTSALDLVTGISSGYDHLGGRLKAIVRNGIPYLFLSVGDHGISEVNDADCYNPQSENPNNQAQNPNADNGKIHRYNMNGSIPADNPIPGNSFYTRGHRNPQGLMYNPTFDLLYDIEHGDRTDDEINLLEAGMNYGWKWVRGYHGDNNYPGEGEFISGYTPHPLIAGDRLVPAFYAWCDEPQPESDEYLEWCTPAPSDGIYYNAPGIPEWSNSLLVVSLKNGAVTDNEVHMFKLTPDGSQILRSTPNANPTTFFGEDQDINGRLRDITYSTDGKKIFLINNGGGDLADKITVYTALTTGITDINPAISISIEPNPAHEIINIQSNVEIAQVQIYSMSGKLMRIEKGPITQINIADLSEGMYIIRMNTVHGSPVSKLITKL